MHQGGDGELRQMTEVRNHPIVLVGRHVTGAPPNPSTNVVSDDNAEPSVEPSGVNSQGRPSKSSAHASSMPPTAAPASG